MFIKYPFAQLQTLVGNSDNIDSQAYNTIKNLFDITRRIYTDGEAFIDITAMQFFQPTEQGIVRQANIVTFISAILGNHDLSLSQLDKHFLEVFVPFGQRLLAWQSVVLLELKTQAYVAALTEKGKVPDQVLLDLFPHDLATRLMERHPRNPGLSPSEWAFLDHCESRRCHLAIDPLLQGASIQSYKILWPDFAVKVISSVIENIYDIIIAPVETCQQYPVNIDPGNDKRVLPPHPCWAVTSSQNPEQPTPSVSTWSTTRNAPLTSVLDAGGSVESTASAGKTRRPWTELEEHTLLAGIESINGPYWSRILALYGRGGSINEVLKDRNQVQLKDKARNLKMQYLKTGREVPKYLQAVTGDLKMRGSAKAKAALSAEGKCFD